MRQISMMNEAGDRLDTLLKSLATLKEEGRSSSALEIIRELEQDYPNDKAALLVVGNFYWDYGPMNKAVEEFERATVLFPDSELASLALFHVLWKAKLQDRALEEIKRFISRRNCDDYDRIIEDLDLETRTPLRIDT